jgi:hypothetical protein
VPLQCFGPFIEHGAKPDSENQHYQKKEQANAYLRLPPSNLRPSVCLRNLEGGAFLRPL